MNGQIIGYVRVSSQEQNTDRQLEILKKNGVDRIFEDKISGKNLDRPEYQNMIDFVRSGDIILVCSLDRLSRSLSDLMGILEKLKEKKVSIKFLQENLEIKNGENDFVSELILNVLGSIYQFERSISKMRQRQGIDLNRSKNLRYGRQCSCSEKEQLEIVKKIENGESVSNLSKEYNVSRYTIYNYIKKHNKK